MFVQMAELQTELTRVAFLNHECISALTTLPLALNHILVSHWREVTCVLLPVTD